jgi:predicted DCC family thiol-disulfide oxidoreductase YuxK
MEKQGIAMAPAGTKADGKPVIVIDGVCVLCSRWYRFVTTRDRDRHFRFVAIQEPEGRAIAARHGVDPDNPTTFLLVDGDCAYARSEAALRILKELPGWGWSAIARIIPRSFRDRCYDFVARRRYRWFGKLEVCMMPGKATEQIEP